MPLVNFHTHSKGEPGELSLLALTPSEYMGKEPEPLCTVGVHPWQTNAPNLHDELKTLTSVAGQSNIIAIGEVGLDKLKGAPMELQVEIFKQQANLAHKHSKPIVIHCVKAWDLLLPTLKSIPITTKRAVHGFSGNATRAKQLLSHGLYLSFGARICNPTPAIAESLRSTPTNSLFLETDVSDIPIREVYSAASGILGIGIPELTEALEDNYRKFFKLDRI